MARHARFERATPAFGGPSNRSISSEKPQLSSLLEGAPPRGEPPCPTLPEAGRTLAPDVSRRVRGLTRGLVTLAEGGDVEAALLLVDQVRDLLTALLPTEPTSTRTRFDRVLEDDS